MSPKSSLIRSPPKQSPPTNLPTYLPNHPSPSELIKTPPYLNHREFLLREQELGYDHEVVVGRRAGGGNLVVIPLEEITTAASPAAADTGLVRANTA